MVCCRLKLGERDYSDLLSPSARVVLLPNSRSRVLLLRKHPYDKFSTHQQVHVTDVLAKRKWVALIVGMSQLHVRVCVWCLLYFALFVYSPFFALAIGTATVRTYWHTDTSIAWWL